MKFEVKTENDNVSKFSFSAFLGFGILSLIVILTDISFKIGSISRPVPLHLSPGKVPRVSSN